MSKKIDLIFKDLTFGALIAILCANCAMILCTAGINFLAKQSINDLLIVLTMIPSVCVGVIAIYYLVCGCLSLQYIRLFMSFGGLLDIQLKKILISKLNQLERKQFLPV